MSATMQKTLIIGNLGADPEVRYTQNGTAIANLSVATTEKWKDKQSGEQKSETEWHRLVCYNRLAEIAGEFLRKGSKVYVEGKLKTRKWQGQDGKDNYTTEIKVLDLQMLDGRPSGQQSGSNNNQSQGGFGGQQHGNPQAGGAPQGGFGGQQHANPQAGGTPQGGFGSQQQGNPAQGGFGGQQAGGHPQGGYGNQGGFNR